MTSRVPDVFSCLAESLHIAVGDLELLLSEGITTADEFYFRHPSPEKLEEFLQEVLSQVTMRWDGDAWVREDRLDDNGQRLDVRRWLRSGDAAALRRLWEASRAASKRDLSRATEEADARLPAKLNIAVVTDIMSRARARGLPEFAETERPGQQTLSRISENYKHAGPWAYLAWEVYLSEEEEALMRRTRMGPSKPPLRLTLQESQLTVVSGEADLQRSRVTDAMALLDVLKVRSVGHAWLEIVEYDAYEEWTRLLIGCFRKRQPELMRGPTIGELRMVDRQVHEEILNYAARGRSSVANGLTWFTGPEGRNHRLLRLLEGQTEDTPDLSLESPNKRRRVDDSLTTPGQQAESAVCWTCGKTRREHQNRQWCAKGVGKSKGSSAGRATQAFGRGRGWGSGQQQQYGGGGGKSEYSSWKGKSGTNESRGGKSKNKTKATYSKGSAPEWMEGCATRTPPSQQFPAGQQFCYSFHHPDNRGCQGSCGMSHRCPRFRPDGSVCMGSHKLADHQ